MSETKQYFITRWCLTWGILPVQAPPPALGAPVIWIAPGRILLPNGKSVGAGATFRLGKDIFATQEAATAQALKELEVELRRTRAKLQRLEDKQTRWSKGDL